MTRRGPGRLILALPLLLLWVEAASASPPRTVLLPGPGYAQVGPQGRVIMRPREAVAERLIVSYNPGLAPLAAHGLAALGGARVTRLMRETSQMIVELPAGSDLLQAAADLERLPGVQFAEPDTLVYPQIVPNDPEYPKQYHLPLVRAPEAWAVTTGSPQIIIAIIDSGVDLNHPDLAGKIWVNPGETVNGLDDDGNGYVDDVHGWSFVDSSPNVSPVPVRGEDNSIVSHGTLAAGIAAALGNDGWGTAGVDWQARVMPIKVFDHNGAGTVSGVVEAINYAVTMGADVINLSLGGSYNKAFTPPIKRAYEAGRVVVVAGGNSGRALTDTYWESPVCNDGPDPNNPLPGNYVLGVAATDQNDRKAWYSNWDTSSTRTFIDLAAPGEVLYGPVYQQDGFPGFTSYFGTNSGTSFSAPIVSGLAALLLAQNPARTPAQIIELIRAGADDIDAANPGYAGSLGTGRANLARSLGVDSPPQPAREVQAADTPGDDGGSLTVTWLRSLDDGAGANDVTRYVVRRRQGPGGSWVNLATLPPGTERYEDATTSDGLDYYYLVRTFADDLFSDSQIAGPAQSRNDAPPPSVTTLTARDRPADQGGAIVLEWTYAPPADFAHYRLYRERYNFTTVAGRTPLVTLAEAGADTYTDTTTSDGVDYFYALTAVDTAGNEHKAVTAVGPVQSFPNTSQAFAAGVQMLAPAVVPPDRHPATLFGLAPAELVYARYDPANPGYLLYGGEPLSEALRLVHGQGFWIDLPRQVSVLPEGQTAPSGDFPVALGTGWHLLGNPFLSTLDFAASTVTHQGNTMDLRSAEIQGLVRAFAWLWDRSLGGYRLLDVSSGSSGLVAPWQGLWVLAGEPCTLNLAAPDDPQAAAVLRSDPPPEPDWSLQLTAEAGPYQAVEARLGVSPQPRQIPAPPPAPRGVALAWAEAGGQAALARLYLPRGQESFSRELHVRWSGVTGPVRVAWPDLSALPGELALTLTDPATGECRNLRHTTGYVFTAEEPIGERRLILEVSRRTPGSLAVTALTATGTREGVEIVFALSQAATCELSLMNIAGRTVRRVLSEDPRAAGSHSVRWDGRNHSGTRVPAGRYLLTLEARDEQGQLVRALRDVSLLP